LLFDKLSRETPALAPDVGHLVAGLRETQSIGTTTQNHGYHAHQTKAWQYAHKPRIDAVFMIEYLPIS
jgi:hypothetical protein